MSRTYILLRVRSSSSARNRFASAQRACHFLSLARKSRGGIARQCTIQVVAAPTVLVVDDDEMIQESIREVLADEGYEVVLAQNGMEALAMLRDGVQPTLILLDLMMPVMDGWQFRAEQKKDPKLAAIPVVVITAAGSAVKNTIEANEFMTKPVRLEDLLAVVKRYLP